MKSHKIKKILLGLAAVAGAYFFFVWDGEPDFELAALPVNSVSNSASSSAPEETIPTPAQVKAAAIANQKVPSQHVLTTDYHVFQTFNNCAAAGLAIAMGFFDIRASQAELAADLRPNNNRKGIDDDKSTPPQELAAKAEEYGLIAYYRGNGNIELMKKLTANGMPVLVRTLLNTEEDYAHYRVIKGYDDVAKKIIQDDSYDGKNRRYAYEDFLAIWQAFNYEYLVLARPEQKDLVEAILGKELDQNVAWAAAAQRAQWELEVNRYDSNAGLNLSVSLYYLGKFSESVAAYEKVEKLLPTRALWYRLEPVIAYFELGNYDRVFALSDKIFRDDNKAYAELYLLRGKSYLKLGKPELAKIEFEKAVLYDKNFPEAREALASVQ